MGIDVSTIFKHNLPVDNLQELATEIANRLNCCVEFSEITWNPQNYNANEIELGKVGIGQSYRLTKELPYPLSNDTEPIHELNYIGTQTDAFVLSQINIYKHIAESFAYPNCRWRGFTETICCNKNITDLVFFRNRVKKEASSFGSDSVIYFPDSGGYWNIQDLLNASTWEQIASMRKSSLDYIDVCETLRNGTWKEGDRGAEIYFDDFSFL